MRRRFLLACTLLAALIAVLGTPWLAWLEAERQAHAIGADLSLRYARQVLQRLEETVQQSLAGIDLLTRSGAEPCSAQAQALMGDIHLNSAYIKTIGHVTGGVLQCSSIGTAPFPLGNQKLRASNDMLIYSRVPIKGKEDSSLIAIERDRFAVLFDSNLPLDASSAIAGMSLAVLHLERRRDEPVTMATGAVDRDWLKHLGDQDELTFNEGQLLVALVRSERSLSVGVAALPLSYLTAQRDAIALRLVPAGLLAGIAIAAALLLLARQQASLAAALRTGLRNDEFFLLYQPVVDLRSDRWIGVEALLRWRRAGGELIGPDVFIPLAEQTGMIMRLTERVLQLVERDTRDFLATRPAFHIAVNVSASDLHSGSLLAHIDGMLARGGARASNLIVEITERSALDIECGRAAIDALRARGIAVAIDDFGTGYAGLSYLEALKIDYLKVDKSFIEAIGTSAPTNQVVDHVIAMSSAMKLVTIAEGIETMAQKDYLRARGVELAQGWLFGKPQRFEDIAAALAAGSCDVPTGAGLEG